MAFKGGGTNSTPRIHTPPEFRDLLLAIARSANKYTDNGWMEVPDGERRYTDAMMRHLLREAEGEECDPDTGLRHAAHAAWNALARLDLALRQAPNAEVTGA